MTGWLAENLLLYSLQLLIVVLAAEAMSRLMLLTAKLRLLHWRAVLVVALLLPFARFQPAGSESGAVSVTAGPVLTAELAGSPAKPLPWREAMLGAIAVGSLLLMFRLAIGGVRIHLYRRRSKPLDYPHPEASFRVSEEVSGPITFGWLRPTILLPAQVLQMPEDQQDAIREHELAHVRRKDWLFAVGEEFIRALLWFHPAIWWVLSHVQTAREQVVDEEVVSITGRRAAYVDALLAIAGVRARLDFVPAPLFLRKRHLAGRVANLLEEVRMSKLRAFGYGAVSLLTVVVTGVTMSVSLPLPAWAWQQEERSQGVTMEAPSPAMRVLYQAAPSYPPEGKLRKVEGTVVVEADVDVQGMVSDARVVSGPAELRRAALQAVLRWQFAPPSQTTRTTVSLNFRLPQEDPRMVAAKGYVRKISFGDMPSNLRERAEARLPVKLGDAMSPSSAAAISRILGEIDGRLTMGFSDDTLRVDFAPWIAKGATGASGGVTGGVSTNSEGGPAMPQRIRVGGNVQASKIDRMVRPEYPALAKQARIQGKVVLAVVIDKTGQVSNIELVSGHPLLAPAAVTAVQQWTYKPTLLNGNPVDVLTQVDVNFTLADEPPPAQP
ncbi:MAG: M56 family metallopeptidase [Bryobacterales bacterium]|nr:M56 family metallopeptidase [Bryobacterales bacterium]